MPPTVIDMLNELFNSAQPSPLDDTLAEISRQAMRAREGATAAQSQLAGAVAAPTPKVSPEAESLLAGMGLAAESFTGKKGAFAYGQGLVGRENENLLNRRRESIAQLEQAYRDAAQRADKMGDVDTSLKFKVKADRELGRLDAVAKQALLEQRQAFEAEQGGLERASRERITGMETASRERIEGMDNAARERIARIDVGSRMTQLKDALPAELSATLAPVTQRMTQLAQARGAIAADPKLKDSQRRKRVTEVDTEYAQLFEQYQNTIASYFKTPAGSTGEAAQTPLGTIMERAKAAGAKTFEDFKRLAYGNSQSALLRGYDLKRTVDAARVMFPTRAQVNKAVSRYKALTSGPLKFSKIAQNRQEIDKIAEQLRGWGYTVTPTEELLSSPEIAIPETVVRPQQR